MDELDPEWSSKNIHKTLDLDMIIERYNKNEEEIEDNLELKNKRENHILFIIDDFATDKALKEKGSIFCKFFVEGRHINCSSIIMSQDYCALQDMMRKNAMYIMIHRVNMKELYLLS